MGNVTIQDRIYVDDKGRRVSEDSPKVARLAAVPGDQVSEERAAELGVKERKPAPDNKERKPGEDKAGVTRIWPSGGKKD